MATLVLRNVPDDLYHRLKQAAADHRRSMTQEAILSLRIRARGAGGSVPKRGRRRNARILGARKLGPLPLLDQRPDDEILGYGPMASSIDLAIDTSALTAVLLREPEARRFLQLLTV